MIVADNGQGMSTQKLNSISNFCHYQPRKRIDKKRPQYLEDSHQSLGISLFICDKIVKINEGQLEFVSKKNQGSIFIFTFKVDI